MKEIHTSRFDYINYFDSDYTCKLIVEDYGIIYLKRGVYHRLDGPAGEWNDGAKCYAIYGKFHRLDGPAKILPNGTVEYWIKGRLYSKDAYDKAVIQYYLQQNNLENYL